MTGQKQIPERQLLMILYEENPKVSLALLRIMMDVLDEMKLCAIDRTPNHLVEVQVNAKAPKINLEDSKILGRLISQCIL